MSSSYSDYSDQPDQNEDSSADELTPRLENAIDTTILKALKGEKTSINDELANLKKENLTPEQQLQKSKEALENMTNIDPNDETEVYLKDFFTKQLWKAKEKKEIQINEEEDDDLEEIDSGLEFEKRYNFRHEEKYATVIESHPRYVDGEDRENITARKRKRQQEHAEKEIQDKEIQDRLDAIDEKYRLIYEQNGNKFTDEQFAAWAEETSAVYIEQQGGAFPYVETEVDGGLEKAVKILEGDDDEKEGKHHHHHSKHDDKKKGHFNKRNPKQKGVQTKHKGNDRRSTYFAHKH